MLTNNTEVRFTTTPLGLESEPTVRFDVSRTVHSKTWLQVVGKGLAPEPDVNCQAYTDMANDDRARTDEDNIPKAGMLFPLDAPGRTLPIDFVKYTQQLYSIGNLIRYVQRMNAWEFVRVKVNDVGFTHTNKDASGNLILAHQDPGNLQGSRSSEHVPWRSRIDFQWDAANKVWVRAANTDPSHPVNYIGAYHDDLMVPAVN